MMDENKQKKMMRRDLTKRLMHQFYKNLFIYSLIILAIFAVSYLFCNDRIWYGNETFYPLVHFMHEHWFAMFMFFVIIGCLFLSVKNYRKMIRLMEYILDAVNRIYRDEDKLIELPNELYEVECELNDVMLNVRSNRQKAVESEQKKNDLIVYMAHDLKTPLTSVIGYLTLLNEEKEITEQLRQKYLGIALDKSERLEDLINEFFEITRFNLSSMTLELSSVNISRMIEQIAYEFIPIFQEKNLTYKLEVEPDLEVVCDVDKIQRLFDNLLKNAVNYSYENTEITIVASQKDNQVEVQFINHGKTIPKDKLERIFDQFFRMESSRTSSSGGAGLGLAIAREIAECHGGTLTCESEDETITFTLNIRKS